MGEPSMNHYEKQLYSVFKSFDVNNEESLDISAVNRLCDALQLEERGATLADTLFDQTGGRVTFTQFRNGLLTVLGESHGAPEQPPPPPRGDSDEESSGRELAPRFVLGSKRYGRRSRPPQAAGAEPRAASASRLEGESAALRPPCRRSASAMERRRDDDAPPLEHDARIDRDGALALCRSLRMHSIDRRLVERIFDESPTPETTVGDFFDRLNSSLASAIEPVAGCAAAPVGDSDDDDDDEAGLPAERVAEMWERAGVRRPRRLLAELGFAGASVRHSELERSLDDELCTYDEPPEGRAALLTAALALARARADAARRARARAAAERDKLRADVAEANRRAGLLAQEVDESHARIETELKASLRRAEARHAEELRRAADEAAAERERSAAERGAREAEAARRADAEARLRAESERLRRLLEEAEERERAAAERREAAESAAARAEARAAEAAARAEAAREEAAAALAEREAELAREHLRLRDRADELAAALEARAAAPPPASGAGDLSTELSSVMLPDTSEGEPGRGDSSTEEDEVRRLRELVKTLEGAVEALRGEYEACEEYWGGKLRAERAAHEAECRAADARLAELLARVADFERRLRPPPALPAIPEARALEAQVEQLEAEFARFRREAAARLAAACAAPRAPAAPARARREAAALAARAARAEAAARRLEARLAAADALVRELYVENCHLARAAL